MIRSGERTRTVANACFLDRLLSQRDDVAVTEEEEVLGEVLERCASAEQRVGHGWKSWGASRRLVTLILGGAALISLTLIVALLL